MAVVVVVCFYVVVVVDCCSGYDRDWTVVVVTAGDECGGGCSGSALFASLVSPSVLIHVFLCCASRGVLISGPVFSVIYSLASGKQCIKQLLCWRGTRSGVE